MSTINLSVDLTTLKSHQVIALGNFINSFNGQSPLMDIPPISVEVTEAKEEPAEKKTRAKRGSTVQAGVMAGQEREESHVDNYEAAKAVEVKEAETVKEEEEDILGDAPGPKHSFDDVRELASKKMQADAKNKDILKAELTRLGLGKLADIQGKLELIDPFYDFADKL